MVMWVAGAGVTLVILLLSTTSNNLSLSFNTNLYHFLRNLNSTKPLCPSAKANEHCRKTGEVENINVPPASRFSGEGIGCKDVGNKNRSDKEVARQEDKEVAREDALAEGFSAWWQLQMERKVLVATVCARFQGLKCCQCSSWYPSPGRAAM